LLPGNGVSVSYLVIIFIFKIVANACKLIIKTLPGNTSTGDFFFRKTKAGI
jgi:hypothetical protein